MLKIIRKRQEYEDRDVTFRPLNFSVPDHLVINDHCQKETLLLKNIYVTEDYEFHNIVKKSVFVCFPGQKHKSQLD